jgi:hypothetical protein
VNNFHPLFETSPRMKSVEVYMSRRNDLCLTVMAVFIEFCVWRLSKHIAGARIARQVSSYHELEISKIYLTLLCIIYAFEK